MSGCGHQRRSRHSVRAGARGPPPGADRLLLPDARLGLRGRGRRAGDDGARVARRRPPAGARGAEVVAVPDREQRLLRHAPGRRSGAPSRWTSARRRPPTPRSAPACPSTPGSSRSPTRRSCSRRGRPGRGRRRRARRCGWRSSPRCSTCRRASAPCSSCARSCAGRPTRSPSCSRRSVASVNSALQRARATLDDARPRPRRAPRASSRSRTRSCWTRYVDAFERYDITSLVVAAARGRHVLDAAVPAVALAAPTRSAAFMLGRASTARARGCSPRRPTAARRSAIYHPAAPTAYDPWAIVVLEISGGRITGLHHFLYPELFAEFGLPPRLEG